MVATDHDRGLEFAAGDHLVELEAGAVPVAEADPADARRKPLERDALLRHVEPAVQALVLGEQLLHRLVGLVDIFRVTRERGPAERTDPPAEERANIGGHETGEGKRVLKPFLLRHLADVVAVIERRHASIPEANHGFDMILHRGPRRPVDRLRIAFLLFAPFGHAPALGQVAVERIVGGCLVGHDIGAAVGHFFTCLHAAQDLGEDVGRIADQGHGLRFARLGPAVDHRQRLVEVVGFLVAITGADTEVGAGLVAFHGKAGGARHDGCQRLGTAHAAEAAGQDPLACQVAVIMLAAGFREGLVGALNDALGADIDPRAGRHLAVHHQALLIELVEVLPIGPVGYQVGVRNEHARRIGMGPDDGYRLARLDEQRFVGFEILQRGADGIEVVPGARSATDPAINDQLVRVFGDIRMQVVHQHAKRRLGQPALGVEFGAGRRVDVALIVTGVGHPFVLSMLVGASGGFGRSVHDAGENVGKLFAKGVGLLGIQIKGRLFARQM